MDTLKKLLMATEEAILPDVSGALCKLSQVLLLTSVGILTASPGWAVVLAPTNITVTIPSGTTNQQGAGTRIYTGPGGTSSPAAALNSNPPQTAATSFVDDILLSSITFAGTTINSSTGIRSGLSNSRGAGALVVTPPGGTSPRRDLISATYGDTDTNSDGNNNPFVTKLSRLQLAYNRELVVSLNRVLCLQ